MVNITPTRDKRCWEHSTWRYCYCDTRFVFQIFLLESGVSSSNRTVQWKLISVFFKTRTNKTNSPKSNGITKIKSYLDLGLLFVTHSLPWDQNLLLQWSGHHESDQCLLLTLSFCFLHQRDLPSVEVMVKMADVLKEIRHLALYSGHGLSNCLDDCCAKAYYVQSNVSKDC